MVESLAFQGVGLRPYPVTALAAKGAPGSDVSVNWIRRTRVDGENWDVTDVPLGESSELYSVQVSRGGVLVREEQVGQPAWSYSAGDQAIDGVNGSFDVSVAQVSDRFGPGPYRGIAVG